MAVLGTKIHVPAPRRDLVPRPRLTERLAAVEHSRPRLVLVSAPTGSGKTTVLSQWLAQGPKAGALVAWLSLDEADNDPRRFLANLLAALQAHGEIAVEAASLVETATERPTETILTSLVNDLDDYAGQIVLALDDY